MDGVQSKTLPDRLHARIGDAPRQVWMQSGFADFGGRGAVDKALQRMVRLGGPLINIEKDFWICWKLNALYHRLGGGERPEFIRQSKLMAHMWGGLDMPASCVVDGDLNHFTVLDGLCDPRSKITEALLGPKSV